MTGRVGTAGRRLQRGRATSEIAHGIGANEANLTVHVPISFQQRGGRKTLVGPDGATAIPARTPHPGEHSAIIRALARAFRWRMLIETGVYATVRDVAKMEKINPSYVSRVLRLTLLAPEIIEAIADPSACSGASPALDRLMEPFPAEWHRQDCIMAR
ncbi:hypothetical protein [Bauldia litoralis]|uniref:Bacteriophage-related protein n=1 Tax=Bauldia litoralis TaxID=665467 RepID=A0A1G6BIA7_9HYPH|nr:hypothetical protein [Bauldia litoralis]SDB20336.1 hypothetical protein SAMN02982931_01485 [Bauldia litoralis]